MIRKLFKIAYIAYNSNFYEFLSLINFLSEEVYNKKYNLDNLLIAFKKKNIKKILKELQNGKYLISNDWVFYKKLSSKKELVLKTKNLENTLILYYE